MATYFDIHGQKVKYVSSDPSTLTEGQVWYNSTSDAAKLQTFSTGAWSSGGALPTGINGNAGAGTQTAGISFGGGTGPVPSYSTAANTYNGTSWTAIPALPFSFSLGGGTGTSTAAIGGGGDGNPPGAVAIWNGSSWTATPTMGKNAYQGQFVGTTTAAVAAGLYYDSSAQEWNGSSWADPGQAMPVHVYASSANGTATDGVWIGGWGPIPTANAQSVVQHYNGTSWTTQTAMPGSAVPSTMSSGSSPTSDLWVFADATAGTFLNSATGQWDGSSWTAVSNMSAPRHNSAAGGTSRYSGFVAGGDPIAPGGGTTTATEEWNGGVVSQTITVS